MKALQVIRPGQVEVVEVPAPQRAHDEYLLQVNMVGMCGSDLNTYLGKNPLVTYPRILGHEISGTILETPEGDASIPPGTRVTLSPYLACGRCSSCKQGRPNACQFNQTLGVQRDGAMAEHICVTGAYLYTADDLDAVELALVEPLTIGFHAVSRGRITSSDTVAVIGCGGVGVGAILGSARRGATVVAIDLNDDKLDLASACGATHTINSQREALHERLQAFTGNGGPDVIIEAIGLPATFRSAVEEVAFAGRVIYIGYAKEPAAYETHLFVQKELDILGSRNASPEDFRSVIEALRQKTLPVDRVVSRIVPISQAPAVLGEWSANPSRFQKILVSIS